MNTDNKAGSDPLERIIRLAGRPRPMNPERADQIEKETKERWQLTVARRRTELRRRRIVRYGSGIAIAASIVVAIIFFSRPTIEEPFVASVVNMVGSPESGAPGHAMDALQVNSRLRAGTAVETASNEGVALQLASGHSLRLRSLSRVRLEADSILLDAGALYLDSGTDGRTSPIEVHSRHARLRELGTQYMAELNDDVLKVTVREGEVRITRGNRATTANAGQMLELDDAGRTRIRVVPGFGEPWAWVTQLAPSPVLEELNLAEFLHWLTREQGWRLEFATPELADYARQVRLYGSIEGLSGEDALATVMSATRWRYRLADGVLIIDARDSAH